RDRTAPRRAGAPPPGRARGAAAPRALLQGRRGDGHPAAVHRAAAATWPGADEALLELLAGLRTGAESATPPLRRASSGPLRVHELLSGVGAVDGARRGPHRI